MKKIADFSTYKHLRKMSFTDFNGWVTSIYMSGVQDGLKEGEKELEECSVFTPEELTSFLQTVPGIGQKTAEKIVDAIIERSENNEDRR